MRYKLRNLQERNGIMNGIAGWTGSLALALALAAPAAMAQEGRGDVVYVPTPQVVVDEMLRMARVGPKDFVIDLGSGDGRIVITAAKQYGARGFGVDLDTYLLKIANAAAKKEGVSDRAHFVEQNLFETDLSAATVITTYLLPEMNEKLRPKLLSLRPGTRVVAHDYAMGDWSPDEEKTLLVPEKVVGDPGKSYIFFWVVPARVAGRWESVIQVGGKPVGYQFSFEQRYQLVHGTVRVGDRELRLPQFRLSGEQLDFSLTLPAGGDSVVHQFKGRVAGDGVIEGEVAITDGAGGRRVQAWKAKQVERGTARMGASAATVVAGGAR
jgi:hypothetical protein